MKKEELVLVLNERDMRILKLLAEEQFVSVNTFILQALREYQKTFNPDVEIPSKSELMENFE